jgi:hypothetical protein
MSSQTGQIDDFCLSPPLATGNLRMILAQWDLMDGWLGFCLVIFARVFCFFFGCLFVVFYDVICSLLGGPREKER